MSIRTSVLTISDRCAAGETEDRSGPLIVDWLPTIDATLVRHATVPDEPEQVRTVIREQLPHSDLILTTGGTGIAPRDLTPEAILPLIERALPGFGEVMRLKAFDHQPLSIVSRGGAGIAGRTLIVWMPGSMKAVRECLEWLAPSIKHVCAFLAGEKPH